MKPKDRDDIFGYIFPAISHHTKTGSESYLTKIETGENLNVIGIEQKNEVKIDRIQVEHEFLSFFVGFSAKYGKRLFYRWKKVFILKTFHNLNFWRRS